jgi:ribosomal protein L7/L12
MTGKYYSDRSWYNKELPLKEAKALTEKPLSLIYEDVDMYCARDIKKEFEKLGAKIKIVVTSWDQA